MEYTTTATPLAVKTLVIGSGFSGLCMGIKLKQAGLDDFVILEKESELGGTWRDNTYPGAECDIPSALYSYSFEHNSEWEFKWSGQAQILKYQQDTAAKYGLLEHLKFGQTVVSMIFDESTHHWLVSTAEGERYQAQHVVTGVGQLHYPSTPSFKNSDAYQGPSFHSAQWDHSVELADKRVAVIGNAASAAQLIPEIAKTADKVSVFQRSANWVLPKIDRPYAPWEQRLSVKVPFITKTYRWILWALGEYVLLSGIKGNRAVRWGVKKACNWNMRRFIKDSDLIAKLTPNYAIGAKRILFSDNYYQALARENVELHTSAIEGFTELGLNSAGIEHQFDVIIFATGFKTNPFFAHIDIQGLGGKSIREAWHGGAQAYLGVATHGFPNLHMLYGPNTNLGHTSALIMLEAQSEYTVRAIRHVENSPALALDITREKELEYNTELQSRLGNMAFSEVTNSWYMDGDKVTNNWVGGTREYERCLKQIDWNDYALLGER